MADVKTEQEPSIEEILESIRQIISEDDKEDEEEEAAVAAAPTAEVPPPEVNLEPKEELVDAAGPEVDLTPKEEPADAAGPEVDLTPKEEPAEAEEVLDLTNKVEPEPEVELEMMDKPETEEVAPAPEAPTDNENLISSATADSSVDALSKLLAGNMAVETAPVGRVGQVTLEEITRELMKPMIKSWLDQNLPGVIEKVVQKEIEKLSRRAIGS